MSEKEPFRSSSFHGFVGTQTAGSVTASIDHLALSALNSALTRRVSRLYNRYSIIIIERAKQLSSDQNMAIEAVRPVSLNYFVDVELLESNFDFGFIDEVDSHEDLDNETLRGYLDGKSKESQTSMTRSSLADLLILSRNGLKWIIEKNLNLTVQHLLNAVRSQSLKIRLASDPELSHWELRKDYKGFMTYSLKVPTAF